MSGLGSLAARFGALVAFVAASLGAQSSTFEERQAVHLQLLDFGRHVAGGTIEARFMNDGSSFFYATGAPADTEIIRIDPVANVARPLLDRDRLRTALESALGHEPPYEGLPFSEVELSADESKARFELEGRLFELDLSTYSVLPLGPAPPRRTAPLPMGPELTERPSPNGPFDVVAKDHDLWLRSKNDGRLTPLTTTGEDRFAYHLGSRSRGQEARWSPDGLRLLAFRTDRRRIHHVPVVHWLEPNREQVSWAPFPATGEPLPVPELHVFDVIARTAVKIDLGELEEPVVYPLGWRPDGSEVLFLRTTRLLKRVEVVAADPKTGKSRALWSDEQSTFIEGLAFDPTNLFFPLADGSGFLWRSERSGWSHLYLYGPEGELVRRLTTGEMRVDSVAAVDLERRYVYYLARDDRARPYDVHLHRVGFDGNGSKRLTEATGVHSVVFTPGQRFFLDTHSTVDRPPAVELRSSDGDKLRVLAEADISSLEALGWRRPEEFRVKAADGRTELHGVLYKPYDFDPERRYPVIDIQYMGNWVESAPRTFSGNIMGDDANSLTQLGFIVFIVDGRGTPGRSKSFQDETYGNVGKIEVADHAAVLEQLASTRPYMDTSRVGITGYSWGGYFTIRALLTAPETFHVGVAGAPVVDFIAEWQPIEPYMGLPQDNPEGYAQGSNLLLADRLEGKLLIQIGTGDVNVTFNHTMRMAHAFIRANKLFDLLVMPGETHQPTLTGALYYRHARNSYFVEHLRP